jgi:hypothetical protein
MSDMKPRRLVVLAALLAVAATLAACGDKAKHTASSSSSTTSSTTESTTTTTAVGGATTTTAAPGAAPSGPGGGTTGTTSKPSSPATAPPATGGPQPVAAGTYHYRQSGTTTTGTQTNPVSADGTLVVDKPKSDGTQVWHQFSSDTTLSFRPDGMFIVSITMRPASAPAGFAPTCTFATPLPSPPWPPTVGKTLTGHGDCGSFTVDVNGKITGTKKVTLDGASVDTFVVETTLAGHGQIELNGTDVEWFAPSLRLPVHEESHEKGSYGNFFSFAMDFTRDLTSGRPS